MCRQLDLKDLSEVSRLAGEPGEERVPAMTAEAPEGDGAAEPQPSHVPADAAGGDDPRSVDAALVKAAQDGSFEAFEALVRRHQGRIYAVSLGMLKRPEEAEEAVQETFLRAFEHLHSFRQDSAFFTWLYRVCVNQCLMRLRKKKPLAAGDLADLEPALAHHALARPDDDDHAFASAGPRAPDDVAMGHEVERAALRALEGLSDESRAIVVMRAFDDLGLEEMAEALGLSVAATKSRLHRARLALREAYQRELGA